MNKLARDLATVDNLSTGLVAPTRKNELMSEQTPIILDVTTRALIDADTSTRPETVESYGRAGEGMSVMTRKTGQYYTNFTTTKATALTGDIVALTILSDMEDTDTGESVNEYPKSWANVFVSREHARKFALAILNELDN